MWACGCGECWSSSVFCRAADIVRKWHVPNATVRKALLFPTEISCSYLFLVQLPPSIGDIIPSPWIILDSDDCLSSNDSACGHISLQSLPKPLTHLLLRRISSLHICDICDVIKSSSKARFNLSPNYETPTKMLMAIRMYTCFYELMNFSSNSGLIIPLHPLLFP